MKSPENLGEASASRVCQPLADCQPRDGDEPVGEVWPVSLNLPDSPYLVKLIDTSAPLSIQVHPEDEFAKRVENTCGKTECWLILEASEGAGVYLGPRPEVGKLHLQEALERGEAIDALLNFYPVRPGDFFYVPAGLLHAIGKDILLAEVQQNSGITYRVWDWNRADSRGRSRQLHLEKAMQVIQFDPQFNKKERLHIHRHLLQNFGHTRLLTHPQFSLECHHIRQGEIFSLVLKDCGRQHTLLGAAGEAALTATGNSKDNIKVGALQFYQINGERIDVTALKDFCFIHVY